MKKSIILIVAGIIIMIVGGIVFVNTIQIRNNDSTSSSASVMKHSQDFINRVDLDHRSQPIIPQSQTIPVAIIVFGIVVFVVGIYDARHTSGV
jgi:hypothetical protein